MNRTTPQIGAAAKQALPGHLRRLEAESIEIIREVAAEFRNPVMLYSIGKDSSVMLHLAIKAFYPRPLPFPLLHVDTTWKFREMIAFRDETAQRLNAKLLVHINQEGVAKGINPFASGSQLHTHVMKTEALKQALDKYQFDAAFGGARRDEEKSRAKERVFSFRSQAHAWDPRNQRPELWNLFNTRIQPGESIRVFPLSNWTELDIWTYIMIERIPVVPLYFAKERPVVWRAGTWIMVDDERMPLEPGETPQMKLVRFRTLGCYPLTGAIESDADNARRHRRRDARRYRFRAPGPAHRYGRGRLDGEEEARRLFLMETLLHTTFRAAAPKTYCASSPAPRSTTVTTNGLSAWPLFFKERALLKRIDDVENCDAMLARDSFGAFGQQLGTPDAAAILWPTGPSGPAN